MVELHKGHLAWTIAVIIIIVLAIAYTGFRFITNPIVRSTFSTSTSTTINGTTSTTTVPPAINYSNSASPCRNFQLVVQNFNTTYTARCISDGSTLGVWLGAGDGGTEHVTIVGADNKTYINATTRYNCTTFFKNFTGPAQIYNITLMTGIGGGSCGNPNIVINTTTTLPKVIYEYIYNGDFANGQYTGWNATNSSFGAAPLNISYADSNLCYQGQPWSNYNGSFFATTYNCGTTTTPGNLTSIPFIANPQRPFLNFRIISPDDNNIYVELLTQNFKTVNGQQVYVNTTPVVIAHFNTYNLSVSLNSSSRFENVTIPLTRYINQVMQIRVVSAETSGKYVAVGDFVLSNKPNQQVGIAANITNTGGN